MVSPIMPNRPLTLAEYLEFEATSPVRYEYVDGEVYAMVGASRRHHDVVGNIYARLRVAATGGPCRVYFEGVRLRLRDDFYYPDLIVTCSKTDTDSYTVHQPCLLVEVTSPTTARSDRTDKLEAYRDIPSLQCYLIVEQAWRRVVRQWRDANGAWQQEDLRGDGRIMLSCPEVMLTFDQIYEGLAPLTVKEQEAIGYGAEGAPPITAPV